MISHDGYVLHEDKWQGIGVRIEECLHCVLMSGNQWATVKSRMLDYKFWADPTSDEIKTSPDCSQKFAPAMDIDTSGIDGLGSGVTPCGLLMKAVAVCKGCAYRICQLEFPTSGEKKKTPSLSLPNFVAQWLF